MKIRGNDVVNVSENGNVAVTYNRFGCGNRYNVYKRCLYSGGICHWEYSVSFGTLGEAMTYAKKIYDVITER